MDLTNLTIKEAHKGLKEKQFLAIELCQAYLKKIEEKNNDIFAFLSVNEESATSQAKKVDKMIADNEEISLMTGIPCAIKDNILIDGERCTAGSKILENYIAPYDATVIKKLKKENAVFLGKTNMDEFAMGSSTENSAYGATKNPHDLKRVPGGSSGGSVATVASNMALCALGSDTGGSIRQPASFCGVVGLKPTYGIVSRNGLIAFGSSLDQIGPIAKNIEDVQILFNTIKGKDKYDSTSVDVEETLEVVDIKNLKIGVPKEYFSAGLDKNVSKIIKDVILKYEKMGAKIEEVSLPNTEYALPAYYIINPCEASANLARFDGIRYGYRSDGAKNLLEIYSKSRGEGFGKEVRRRIMIGTYSLSSGYYDAYYLKAQKIRNLVKNDFKKVFEKVDVIMGPTTPNVAFKIGEKLDDPLAMYLEDIYTVSINMVGVPAVSIPVGIVGNLPVGLQIIGNFFNENKILEVGKFLENDGKNN